MAKKKSKPNLEDQPSIEDAMEELQEIVETLESGQTALVDSMSKYERGMSLLKSCHEQLEQAAQRIEIVTGMDRDGNAIVAPFDGTATASMSIKRTTRQPQIVENANHSETEDGVDPASLF